MTSTNIQHKRRDELLADRAVQTLSSREADELSSFAGAADDSFDRAAAVLDLAIASMTSSGTEMPPAELLERIQRDATACFAPQDSRSTATYVAKKPNTLDRSPSSLRAVSGWVVAALSLIALVVIAIRPGSETAAPTPQPTIAEQRASLLKVATDIVQKEWTATDDLAAVSASGDVVWSDKLQRGFMTFRGLAANDPTQEQYQLWIFDRERDDAYPVDGGVFDIPAGLEEATIPIDARLPIADAKMFAITIEKPGGVVVSSRERLPLLAQL